jgi:hypothetical protein
MPVQAIAHVSRLRGGSQAQLMLAGDGHKYAVKFQDNPQSTRVLANEYLAIRLAQLIGLSVPQPTIIAVEMETIRRYGITFRLAGRELPVSPGVQFGSRWIEDNAVDWLPEPRLKAVKNRAQFAGVLAFDKWTCNADSRQAIFHRSRGQRKHTATFIDFGYCFNAGEWSFPDEALRGAYPYNEVYEQITSWKNFEPWLSRIENCCASELQKSAEEIPQPWCGARTDLDRLLESLFNRRDIVRDLIDDFRMSTRGPFPNWGKASESSPDLLPITASISVLG